MSNQIHAARFVAAATLAASILAPLPSLAQSSADSTYGKPRTNVVLTSFDGTPIIANFLPAEGLAPGAKAPTVMIGSGWSLPGEKLAILPTIPMLGAVTAAPLRKAGYNVVTWDPRGFGGSGGMIHLNRPGIEGRDAKLVLDWAAQQPEVLLDAPGDPRIGMVGASYGGAIQYVLASMDRRIDAIVPSITWRDNHQSLYPNDTFKTGWGAVLCSTGVLLGEIEGWLSPAGFQVGNLAPDVRQGCDEGMWTGRLSKESADNLGLNAFQPQLPTLRAPTMIIQGTVDTLFNLDEARQNYEQLKGNGIPLRMVWFCGGHGACNTQMQADRTESNTLKWFAKYLKGQDVDTGPAFEYPDQLGHTYGAPAWPMPQIGELVGTRAQGNLFLTRLDISGIAIFSLPALNAIDIPLPKIDGTAQTVGAPSLSFTYSGWAISQDARLYAQVVDVDTWTVVGQQAKPVKITLDGTARRVDMKLEYIAHTIRPRANLKVQIFSRSGMYAPQTTTSWVDFRDMRASLPLVQPGTQIQ